MKNQEIGGKNQSQVVLKKTISAYYLKHSVTDNKLLSFYHRAESRKVLFYSGLANSSLLPREEEEYPGTSNNKTVNHGGLALES